MPRARDQLVEMVERMVVAEDAAAIPRYDGQEFVMFLDGMTEEYEAFRADRVGARMWITTSRPDTWADLRAIVKFESS